LGSGENGIKINKCLRSFPDFKCPETNGFFPDPEQCDLYYECVDNIPEAKLCPDGLLFEDGNPNQVTNL